VSFRGHISKVYCPPYDVQTSDLTEEIKGPAEFSFKTGAGCKFEEPAMNQLINDIFGDGYISLECQGGECLKSPVMWLVIPRILSGFD
jgi:hypothetical protein